MAKWSGLHGLIFRLWVRGRCRNVRYRCLQFDTNSWETWRKNYFFHENQGFPETWVYAPSHGVMDVVLLSLVVETSLIPIQMNWWYQRAIPENAANWKWHLSHSDESEPGWKHIAWSPDYLAHRYTIFLCIWAGKYRWLTLKYKYEWQRSSSWAINYILPCYVCYDWT